MTSAQWDRFFYLNHSDRLFYPNSALAEELRDTLGLASGGDDCTDRTDAQLAVLNDAHVSYSFVRHDVKRYPRSCLAVDAETCTRLLIDSFVYIPDDPTRRMAFNVAKHPCPSACSACPTRGSTNEAAAAAP